MARLLDNTQDGYQETSAGERRQESRLERKIRVFVYIHKCNDNPDLAGVSVACKILDISRHGLRLQADQELLPNTVLNITIGIGDPFAMYLLRGHIRGVAPIVSSLTLQGSLKAEKTSDDEYYVDVLLSEGEDTDLAVWVDQFNHNVLGLR